MRHRLEKRSAQCVDIFECVHAFCLLGQGVRVDRNGDLIRDRAQRLVVVCRERAASNDEYVAVR
ncbi:MAG: hypothetical protein E6G39_04090 [Actinobacteria bacterium]|nr:MAG: hypothetical protein E6G39_04090 [Actinomycetota bacterium]